ncbi:MAG: holin [[Ruminococcus] torques]|uniref:holin n=1 Tax=[Ruminococcus] torques TaxID=33039 RepID=UPI002A826761|nr:holin [[Ruminococcus] torques]MDY3952291.1 holin [[Ruminococcus] torques]
MSLIGADMVNIVSLDWVNIAGVCATAGVISLLMSLKGLPEVNVPEYRDSEGE